ncbi:MAG TPA: RNA polymerase sigma factor [Prolixibacteraceae bacterium]|nr:RNA polymerase sigma factor [Prolixibacteraceae bacterium]
MIRNKPTSYHINELIETYEEGLYWYLRKIIISHDNTKDVLQETFVRVWKNLGSFKGEAKISTWIYRIAHNEAIRFLEKEKRRYEELGMTIEEGLKNKLQSDEYVSGDDIQMKLQMALLKLPVTQRSVFTMRYFDEMSYDDIAEILETSVNSLKVSYHHAKNKIEEILKTE